MNPGYRYLFGPVRSRRLGRSLGIDLVPQKVCTYDCPYCQVGVTTDKTLSRREYVPVDAVLAEFDQWLAQDGQADCVTLAGAGEPTLHSRFGDVIDAVGARSSFRRILLSNGSLFSLPEVRRDAAKADVVKATFSAWDQASFLQVHHPHPSLMFELFFEGLKAFRQEFKREYWLEIFVVPGLNDREDQMVRIAALAKQIAPDHIHLNTAVRPAQDGVTRPVSPQVLQDLSRLFSPAGEVIASLPASAFPDAAGSLDEAVWDQMLALIRRHPSTAADLALALNQPQSALEKGIQERVARGLLRIERRGSEDYYIAL